jgi:hypothetical protein
LVSGKMLERRTDLISGKPTRSAFCAILGRA